MELDLISEKFDEGAQFLFSAAAVPGDTEVVEDRAEVDKENYVGISEGIREEKRPETFAHPTVVLIVGPRVHQRIVKHALGAEEDGESPHGHLGEDHIPEGVQNVHAEPVTRQSDQNVEQGCQGDQGGIRTLTDHESGLPISVLVKDPVFYRNEDSCHHDENG